jgi:hypothetical protein
MSEPRQSGSPAVPAYGPPYPLVPQDHPQGTTVLVLGIVGLFVAICAPFAWYIGSKALKEIRASGTRYANEQQIVIGRILGMIVTILLMVSVLFGIVFAAIITLSAVAGSR